MGSTLSGGITQLAITGILFTASGVARWFLCGWESRDKLVYWLEQGKPFPEIVLN